MLLRVYVAYTSPYLAVCPGQHWSCHAVQSIHNSYLWLHDGGSEMVLASQSNDRPTSMHLVYAVQEVVLLMNCTKTYHMQSTVLHPLACAGDLSSQFISAGISESGHPGHLGDSNVCYSSTTLISAGDIVFAHRE